MYMTCGTRFKNGTKKKLGKRFRWSLKRGIFHIQQQQPTAGQRIQKATMLADQAKLLKLGHERWILHQTRLLQMILIPIPLSRCFANLVQLYLAQRHFNGQNWVSPMQELPEKFSAAEVAKWARSPWTWSLWCWSGYCKLSSIARLFTNFNKYGSIYFQFICIFRR